MPAGIDEDGLVLIKDGKQVPAGTLVELSMCVVEEDGTVVGGVHIKDPDGIIIENKATDLPVIKGDVTNIVGEKPIKER